MSQTRIDISPHTWQPGWWLANVWLLFLLFPLIAIISVDDLSSTRKVVAACLLVVFAAMHALGYRALIRRHFGVHVAARQTSWQRLIDPNGTELWFALMVLTFIAGALVAGWAMLGSLPFLVTYSVFNFSWRTTSIVASLCVTTTVVGPVIAGRFGELWFLTAILVSAGGATALARLGDERQHDLNALQTQLMVSEERTRVARDVHDVLGHSLTAIVLKTQVAERALQKLDDSPEVDEARLQIKETQRISRRALAEIRATVSGLRTANLADEITAARSVLADAGVNLTVHGDVSAVSAAHHEVLGWTVRESVTNIIRHAEAHRCTIEVSRGDCLLQVADDGVGVGTSDEGNGLSGLRERLATDGLALDVQAHRGTTLRVVPLGAM